MPPQEREGPGSGLGWERGEGTSWQGSPAAHLLCDWPVAVAFRFGDSVSCPKSPVLRVDPHVTEHIPPHMTSSVSQVPTHWHFWPTASLRQPRHCPPAHWNAMAHQRRSAAVTAAILVTREAGESRQAGRGAPSHPRPSTATWHLSTTPPWRNSTQHSSLSSSLPVPITTSSVPYMAVCHTWRGNANTVLSSSFLPTGPSRKGRETHSPHGDLGAQWCAISLSGLRSFRKKPDGVQGQ